MNEPASVPGVSPSRPRNGLRWYRSLYWRIALGLVAFLALMLTAQAGLLLWVADRIAGSMPASSPQRLAVLVASDVGAAMAEDAALDLDAYLAEQYGRVLQAFIVVLRDGRIASNHDDLPADTMAALRAEAAAATLRGRGFGRRGRGEPPPRIGPFRDGAGRSGGPREGAAPEPLPDGVPPPPGPDDPGGRPRRVLEELAGPRRGAVAAVIVNGVPVGRVAVVAGRPAFNRVIRQLGPTLGLVAGGVLLLGTALIAFVVFGPTRRRLSDVQSATERLGTGDLEARAPEQGGDEVAALARSFNRMADELGSRARALESSDNARRQLLADVSHELMTPLTAMRGYIETLTMTEVELDAATRQRYMGIVMDETHRLEQIIGDLLDLARLDGGGITLRHEPVDIAALFERVAARHERELHAREITLERQVDTAAATVLGDADRLEQALQNLAANALRHTPAGGTIALTAAPAAGNVVLTVRDSGPGVAPEHLPLIFDRFYKADAARKAAGGSGLGLSIVKAIVERHGGTITARNDDGAVFEIVLPSSPHDSAG